MRRNAAGGQSRPAQSGTGHRAEFGKRSDNLQKKGDESSFRQMKKPSDKSVEKSKNKKPGDSVSDAVIKSKNASPAGRAPEWKEIYPDNSRKIGSFDEEKVVLRPELKSWSSIVEHGKPVEKPLNINPSFRKEKTQSNDGFKSYKIARPPDRRKDLEKTKSLKATDMRREGSRKDKGELPKSSGAWRRKSAASGQPNRISAETFSKIGQTTDDEKYVMGSDTETRGRRSLREKDTSKKKTYDLEVEFVQQKTIDREDVEIEFVDNVEVDKFVNKISAGTYRRIGNTEEDKYVMSLRQPTWSKIVEQKKPVEQPVLRDIHDTIKEKMKSKEELTATEREILRQKRRDRRQREKATKRRQREEKNLAARAGNVVFISSDVLKKISGPTSSSKKEEEKRNIRFQDTEYPDLGIVQRSNKEIVLHREIRDSTGTLLSDNQDTGSEWETDISEIQEHADIEKDAENADCPEVLENESTQPLSYSSILKSKKQAASTSSAASKANNTAASRSKQSDADKEKINKTVAETPKKKVKTKTPIEVDLLDVFIKKEGKAVKKSAVDDKRVVQTVLGGKIKREPEKAVRNKLDSSAPTRKRGKEREGGKKKKLKKLKKIILAEKAERRQQREAAAERRTKRIEDGVRLKPLAVPDFDLNEGPTDEIARAEQQSVECKPEGEDVKVEETDLISTANPSQEKTEIKVEDKLEDKVEDNLEDKGEGTLEDKAVKEELQLTNEQRAKMKIHSRKYRDYCYQDLSKDLDTYVTNLMSDLIRFQDRQHAKDPVKAKARRRYVVGLRETEKFLKVKKVTCVILAPDLEKITSEGGLDSAVDSIIGLCKQQNVPVVFSLGRYKLGKACLRKAAVSCVAVMNAQGSDENFKNMVELSSQLKESYTARLKIEVENLEAPPRPTSSLKYIPGKEFVPKQSNNSLRYSPGKEFYPKRYQADSQLQYAYWSAGISDYTNSYVHGGWNPVPTFYSPPPPPYNTYNQTDLDGQSEVTPSPEIPHLQRVLNILKS